MRFGGPVEPEGGGPCFASAHESRRVTQPPSGEGWPWISGRDALTEDGLAFGSRRNDGVRPHRNVSLALVRVARWTRRPFVVHQRIWSAGTGSRPHYYASCRVVIVRSPFPLLQPPRTRPQQRRRLRAGVGMCMSTSPWLGGPVCAIRDLKSCVAGACGRPRAHYGQTRRAPHWNDRVETIVLIGGVPDA